MMEPRTKWTCGWGETHAHATATHILLRLGYAPIHEFSISRTDRFISFVKPALNLRSYIH